MQYRSGDRKRSSYWPGILAAFVIVFLLVPTSSAQDATKEDSINRIEIKEGKLFVNGEMVKELDNSDLPVIFSNGENDGKQKIIISSNGDDKARAFAFSNGNGVNFMRDFDGPNPELYEYLEKDHENALFDKTLRLRSMEGVNGFALDNDRVWSVAGPRGLDLGRANSKEIMQLERKSMELSRSYRSATDDEKTAIQSELTDVLNQIFDLKQDSMNERIASMTSELNTLRERVDERSQSKSDVVTRRYRELIGEKDALAW